MADYIVMPKLGFDMREGVLNTWLKAVGDSVSKGEIVAEIESDKATLELESQVAGTLLQLLHEPGDVVPVGANMAIVGKQGENVAELTGDDGSQAAAGEATPTKTQEEPKQAADKPTPPTSAQAPAAETSANDATPEETYPGGVKATPVARRLAEEKQIDLLQVKGSGPDGRVTKADVESYVAAPQPKASTAQVSAAVPATTSTEIGSESEAVPLTRLRQAIGRRMVESKTTVPHFYVTTEIDMEAALELRKQVNATLPDDAKVSVNDIIVKAAALAVRDFPNLNAELSGDKVVRHKHINIGSAVGLARRALAGAG